MEGFTLIDAGVGLVIVVSALLAYARGFVREILSIGGWVLAAVAAYYLAPTVEPIVKELPFVSDIVGTSCQLAIFAAFAAVFVGALIVISLFTPLFANAVQNSAIGPIDSGFGFLFGVLRGVLLIAVAFIVYDQVTGGEAWAVVDDAASRDFLRDAQNIIAERLPTEIPPGIQTRYDALLGNCQ